MSRNEYKPQFALKREESHQPDQHTRHPAITFLHATHPDALKKWSKFAHNIQRETRVKFIGGNYHNENAHDTSRK